MTEESKRSSLDRVEHLIDELASRDPAVRADAVYELGRLGDDRATDQLILALEDPELTQPAAWALGEIEASRAVRHLLRLLKDENPRVQSSAARALGQIEDGQALVPLLELVCDPQTDGAVRRAAVYSLHELGYERQDRKPDSMAPLIMYGLGAGLLAASVAFSTVIGPFAAIVFFVGLGLLVVYWARQTKTSGGAWYSDSEGGDAVWIPGEPSDPGAGFGGDAGGNGGGAS